MADERPLEQIRELGGDSESRRRRAVDPLEIPVPRKRQSPPRVRLTRRELLLLGLAAAAGIVGAVIAHGRAVTVFDKSRTCASTGINNSVLVPIAVAAVIVFISVGVVLIRRRRDVWGIRYPSVFS